MLDQERVHGDLSAYNILYWEGKISLIDFPQAINPHRNPNAYPIFQRDVKRVCDYFSAQGVRVDPITLAEELWTRHGYSTAPNILWDYEGDEMMKVTIRPETSSDLAAIKDVCDQAFGRNGEGLLVDSLRALEEFEPALSLVAEVGGKVVGHVLLLPVWVRAESAQVLRFEPRPNRCGS